MLKLVKENKDMTNKITSNDLHSLLVQGLDNCIGRSIFHFSTNYKTDIYSGEWLYYDKVRAYYEPMLNQYFFNPLVKKYPEMEKDVENFWDEFKNEKYIESLLSKIFSERINASDLPDLLFRDDIKHSDQARRDLMIKLVTKEPELINLLQENLLTTIIEDKHGTSAKRKGDLIAYIELLPKHHSFIKNKNEIRNCVKLISGSNLTPSSNLKSLTTLYKILPKNNETIDFLGEIFSNYFNEQHNLRSKFQDYSLKVNGNLKLESNEKICTGEEFITKIEIPEHVLIDNCGVSKNNTKNFAEQLTVIFNKIMYNKFNDTVKLAGRFDFPKAAIHSIYLNSPNNDIHMLVKDMADKILTNLDDLSIKYSKIMSDSKVANSEQKEEIKKMIDAYSTKIILENSLNNPSQSNRKSFKI